MDALADLIRSRLDDADDRGRFASVHRLSVIGQKLLLEGGPKPEDVRPGMPGMPGMYGGDQYGGDVGLINPGLPAIGGNIIAGGGGDAQQMVREMIALIEPMTHGARDQAAARQRESLATELNQLVRAREQLDLTDPVNTKITKRIEAILTTLGDEDGLSVVPAVDVRRHQSRPGFGQLDAPHDYGPFADRENGDAGPLQEGRDLGPVDVPVDDIGQDLGPGSRLEGRADPRAQRLDHEGSELLAEAAQTAPEAGLGGQVLERPSRAGNGSDVAGDRFDRGEPDIREEDCQAGGGGHGGAASARLPRAGVRRR